MLGRIDGKARLSRQLDPPAAVLPDRPWTAGAAFEHTENSVRPEMLMHVERVHPVAM